jgi:hypothetical protein
MRTAALLAISLLAGCSNGDAVFNHGSLDRPFSVAYAQQVTIPNEELTIDFTQLNEDSRCPLGTICVIAGQATITITATKTGSPGESFTLTLGPVKDTNTATYLNYTITLVKLTPYPMVNRMPVPSEYVATLVVTK